MGKARMLNIREPKITVYDLENDKALLFVNMSPAEALRAAYRLSKGDANTWAWDDSEEIQTGEYGWHLGNFSVPFQDKEGKKR